MSKYSILRYLDRSLKIEAIKQEEVGRKES